MVASVIQWPTRKRTDKLLITFELFLKKLLVLRTKLLTVKDPLWNTNQSLFTNAYYGSIVFFFWYMVSQSLPCQNRFNATKFLEKLRNKRLVFVGDSVNRNQWVSMVCMVEHFIPDGRKMRVYNGSLISFKAFVCLTNLFIPTCFWIQKSEALLCVLWSEHFLLFAPGVQCDDRFLLVTTAIGIKQRQPHNSQSGVSDHKGRQDWETRQCLEGRWFHRLQLLPLVEEAEGWYDDESHVST